MNLATLRPPPANDTHSDEQLAVTALRLDDGYRARHTRLPGYIVGRVLSMVRSGASIRNSSVRRVTLDFLTDSLPPAVNLEVVASRMGAHGELSRFRMLQGARTVARGAVILDTSWPAIAGPSGYVPLNVPRLSEQVRRMRQDTDEQFYRFDASAEFSRLSAQARRGGYIRFRDARAINAQAIAELSDSWSMLREPQVGTTPRCTSVTIDFCVPLASRSWDRLRFLRVEQQSDALIQGATIEHGSVSTHDGEQLAEFQRVVTGV